MWQTQPMNELSVACAEHLACEDEEAVLALLEETESEFVPPLSKRTSTHQTDLSTPAASDRTGVEAYFAELAGQPFLLAREGRRFAGFLSYIRGFDAGWIRLGADAVYITTICTAPEFRHRGVASALYRALEKRICPSAMLIRTWSTNGAQRSLLEKGGYRMVRCLADDRGPGIDTLYYLKELGKVSI